MSDQDQYQQMIYQIRDLLTPTNIQHYTANDLSQRQVKQCLAEAYQLVGTKLLNPSHHLIHSKITEASLLLSEESDMIKNYVKQKIQAQVFSNQRLQTDQDQYQRLIEARDQLEKQRWEEKLEESKKINGMIESVRKFRNYENKGEVPLPQMEALLHHERAFVDNVVKEEMKIKSQNNQLPSAEGLRNNKMEFFGQKIDKKNYRISKAADESFQIEVTGFEEDETTFLEKKILNFDTKFAQTLSKKRNFLKIFGAFLTEQLKKMEMEQSIGKKENNLGNTRKQKKAFVFSNQLEYQTSKEPQLIGMRQLSRMYKFKPFVEIKEKQTVKVSAKNQFTKKLISKRIGTSNKYHMKQCIIKDNVFYYADEQNKEEQVKLKDMKTIEIGLSPIEEKSEPKQEGSLFQSKETMTEVAILKGIKRDFVFEVHVGQGTQLKEEISKVILRKLHRINCIITGNNNADMGKLIQSDHSILNLSEGYVPQKQEYPQPDMRNNFLKLLIGLLSMGKNISHVNFYKCNLSLDELKVVLQEFEKHFRKIESFNFSRTKLDKETLKVILNLVLKCSTSGNVKLSLQFCGLDDEVIEGNLSILSDACTKINTLLLTGNELTSKSVRRLSNILASKVCQVKTLDLSMCLIQDFEELANMIKSANKLQTLKANECRLILNNQKVMVDLLRSTADKQEFKQLELRRMICTGTIKWFEEIGPYLQIHVDLPGKFGNKSLQSKFVKVSHASNLK